MDPIIKLSEVFDYEQLIKECNIVRHKDSRQIYISSHDGNTYEYPSGEEYFSQYRDQDLNKINSIFSGSYTEEVYNTLDETYGICRARFMILTAPKYRGYSYHKDFSKRLHIPIQTDENCMFIIEDNVYRLPELGCLYEVDTTRKHSAINLGWSERIHMVALCTK